MKSDSFIKRKEKSVTPQSKLSELAAKVLALSTLLTESEQLDTDLIDKVNLAMACIESATNHIKYSNEDFSLPKFTAESADKQLESILAIKENATAGATGASNIGVVTDQLNGELSIDRLKKKQKGYSNIIKRPKSIKVKGGH